MSEKLSFENIKPVEKFNKSTATNEELIVYIEKLEGQLESMNYTVLAMIDKEKNYNPMGGYISRSAVNDKIEILDMRYGSDFYWEVRKLIDSVPSRPLPAFKEGYKQAILDGKTNFSRQEGEWIIVKDEKWGDSVKCPFCGKELAGTDLNFCCKCGAKLVGSEKMNGGKEE